MPRDYDAAAALERIEHELIDSMMRNLRRHLDEESDMGFDWDMWQVKQLEYLEEYRKRNQKKYGPQFRQINLRIKHAIQHANVNGQKDEEKQILKMLSEHPELQKKLKPAGDPEIQGAGFFKINDRKLDALINATQNDMTRAEHAVLRRCNDQYRKIIFDAQMYANTGAGTVEKAIDMATHDFIARGIDSIVYKNGARHTISDYADMAIRTAERRAALMGAGEMRKKYGAELVIVNRRGTMKNGNFGHACPKCIPWLGQILIDDVYSGGKPDGKHQLVSTAMQQGFLHPRCKDSFHTYYPGITSAPDPVTKKELQKGAAADRREAQRQYAERQVEKYERLAETRLDPENRQKYDEKISRWNMEAEKFHAKANQSYDPFLRAAFERRVEQMTEIMSNKALQAIFRNVKFRDGGPIRTITDVTQQLIDDAKPGIGKLLIDNETEISDRETTRWLHKLFGGDIHCLAEQSKTGKMPDALWRNRYWEYKAPTTKNAIDDRLRKGNKQLLEALIREKKQDSERGLVIDIAGMTIDKQEAVLEIQKRAIQRCKGPTTVIIKDGDKYIMAFRVE